jgi:hypothetical protein
MDLSEYAESLRKELTSITRFAGEDITRAAEMLAETLDSSVRLALLDVLSAAADEITSRLDGATIDVRLTGTEPEFVVNLEQPREGSPGEAAEATEEAGSARVTLRISDATKARVDAAAAAAGLSANAWVVRAIARALDAPPGGPRPRPFPPAGPRGQGRRYTGFARS